MTEQWCTYPSTSFQCPPIINSLCSPYGGCFPNPGLTSTRQTGSPDSISKKPNSHLKLSTGSHSFSDGLVPFQKSPLYIWAQENIPVLIWKGASRWAVPSTSNKEGNQLKDEQLLLTYYSAPHRTATESALCLSSQCLLVTILKILVLLTLSWI